MKIIYAPRIIADKATTLRQLKQTRAACLDRVLDAQAMGAPILAASWQADLDYVEAKMKKMGWPAGLETM